MIHTVHSLEHPSGDNPMGNRFYGYRTSYVGLDNGEMGVFHGVAIGDTVHTVAIDDDELTYFVRQKRPNLRRPGQEIPWSIELPGGFAATPLGESPDIEDALETAARQELASEVGMTALHMSMIGTLNVAPGLSDEIDHVFLGTQLQPAAKALIEREQTETHIEVISMPFGEAYDAFTSGREPVSAATLSALALAKHYLETL